MGKNLPNIPVAVGVGRTCPSQPSPKRGSLPHIPRARGGGRSPSSHENNEQGQTQRETLEHLFGITGPVMSRRRLRRRPASHEKSIRRMPPFTTTSVADGAALMLTVGVIRKVVTSSSTLDSLPLHPLLRGLRSRPVIPIHKCTAVSKHLYCLSSKSTTGGRPARVEPSTP